MTKTIAIEGMHCQHCVGAVKEALAAVAGVTSVVVSLENNNAVSYTHLTLPTNSRV